MTCKSEIHVGDIGTTIQFAFLQNGEVLPIGGADQLRAIFTRPDGTSFMGEAQFATPGGADGLANYVTKAGDLNLAGTWKAQAYTENLATPEAHHSEIVAFEVYPNLLPIPDDLELGVASVGVTAPAVSILIA